MKQLFPGATITTVAYGQDKEGFPMVLVATSDGDIVTLTADGHDVEPDFKLAIRINVAGRV